MRARSDYQLTGISLAVSALTGFESRLDESDERLDSARIISGDTARISGLADFKSDLRDRNYRDVPAVDSVPPMPLAGPVTVRIRPQDYYQWRKSNGRFSQPTRQ